MDRQGYCKDDFSCRYWEQCNESTHHCDAWREQGFCTDNTDCRDPRKICNEENHLCEQVECLKDSECPGRAMCENNACVGPKMLIAYAPLNMQANQVYYRAVDAHQAELIKSFPSLDGCSNQIKKVVLTSQCTLSSEANLLSLWEIQDCVNKQISPKSYDYFVALTPNNSAAFANSGAGLSFQRKQAFGFTIIDTVPGVISSVEYPTTTAHEFGHLFGLKDEYCNCPSFCNVDPNPLKAELGCDPQRGKGCCWEETLAYSCPDTCYGNQNRYGGRSYMSFEAIDPATQQMLGTRYHDNISLNHLAQDPRLSCDVTILH